MGAHTDTRIFEKIRGCAGGAGRRRLARMAKRPMRRPDAGAPGAAPPDAEMAALEDTIETLLRRLDRMGRKAARLAGGEAAVSTSRALAQRAAIDAIKVQLTEARRRQKELLARRRREPLAHPPVRICWEGENGEPVPWDAPPDPAPSAAPVTTAAPPLETTKPPTSPAAAPRPSFYLDSEAGAERGPVVVGERSVID
jgi:hypothetical protein